MVREPIPEPDASASGSHVAPEVRRAAEAAADPARLRLDVLLAELMDRAGDVLATQGRLRALLDAVVSIAEDLSLQAVLQRIVDAARELVDARYGALGVVGPDRRTLTDFITSGLSADQVAKIGDLPRGHGILGVVIDEPWPLRLPELRDHVASFGFPPGHPPMTTFLGVPLRIRSRVFGNLYLTDKVGGREFTAEDEQLVVALASAAGVAIQNAQLFEDQRWRQGWLAASAEVRSATLAGLSRPDLLGVVVEQCRTAADAQQAVLALPNSQGELLVAAKAGPDGPIVGASVSGPGSPFDLVMTSRSPQQVDDLGTVSGEWCPPEYGACGRAALAPLGGDEVSEQLGVLAVAYARTPHVPVDDFELLTAFANQVAIALQLTAAQHDRERLAVFEDRDRIARDLHDLVIQRLFAAGMTLQSVSSLVTEAKAHEKIGVVIDDLDATIRDLRQAIYQLQAEAQDDDLRFDIQRLVDQASATSPAQVRLHLVGLVATAVPDALRGHLLAVLREALSNSVRHAAATSIDVTVDVDHDVTLIVDDDGVGIDPSATRRSGLANLQARATECFGSLQVGTGSSGTGTRLIWRVPLDGAN